MTPAVFGIRSNISPKLLQLQTSNLIHGFVWGMPSGRTNNFPSKWAWGHVAHTISIDFFSHSGQNNAMLTRIVRSQSCGLVSLTAGLQSLWLASRLKPWLRTSDGLGWLTAASHGLQVQTRKLTAAN